MTMILMGTQFACNERQEMQRIPRSDPDLVFLGPIPEAFVNKESRDTVQERLRILRLQLGDLVVPFLDSEPHQRLDRDGLSAISQCDVVTELYGGLIKRSALQTTAFARDLSNLGEHRCSDVLLAFGSNLPMVLHGFYGQMIRGENIATLQDDRCMRFAEVTRPSPRAGISVKMNKRQALSLYPQSDISKFLADFEAGSKPDVIALRGEIEVLVEEDLEQVYQGAALATYVATTNRHIDTWRVEMLKIKQNDVSQRLWLSSQVAVDYGEPARLLEKTDWILYANNLVVREIAIHVNLVATREGFAVDIKQVEQGRELLSQLKLSINNGICRLTAGA